MFSSSFSVFTFIFDDNMILLLSYSGDASIDYVISWLKTFNHSYIRINADEILDSNLYLSLEEKRLIYKNTNIDVDSIRSVWYRKFGNFSKSNYFHVTKYIIASEDLNHLAHEHHTILYAFMSLFKDIKWLTPPGLSGLNKLDTLLLAKKSGLDIPESYIISRKGQLIDIQKASNKAYISKSVYEPHFIHRKDGIFSMFTKEIKNIEKIPDVFFPSLIQEKIDKEYELRIFYIDGEFYTMAIFSQEDKETELDFRKVDWENPNKRVPYKLPFYVEERLTDMLNLMKLNCCSIDIIKSSIDGKYYFLEINPTGEFGMTSIPCNYEIFKKIALTLIEMDKHENL